MEKAEEQSHSTYCYSSWGSCKRDKHIWICSKAKEDENCSKRSKDSASITVQSFYYYSNTSWDGKVADLVNRRKSDLERCVTCTMNKILESNVPLASNNYFLSPCGIVRCWFLLQDSILVFVCYPHLTRLGTTRVLTTRWAPPVKGNKN